MPVYKDPVSLILPVQIGYLKVTFFINQNLCLVNEECDSPPHNHHHYEIFFFEQGSGNLMINYKGVPVREGDILIIHPHEYHFQNNNREIKRYNLRFTVEPQSNKPAAVQAFKSFTEYLDGVQFFDSKHCKIPLYFSLLKDEIYDLKNGYVCTIRSICSLLMAELIRLSDQSLSDVFPSEELKYHGYVQTRIDTFFRTKYLSNVKIWELARDMNVSVRQVNNILHKAFGMSFTQKLMRMRLELAANQLIYTDAPISQICQDCGFSSQNYFSSHFKKIYGMTPSLFRAYSRKNLVIDVSKKS